MYMNVKIVSAKELYPIRHEVLRPGKPITSTHYQKDNHLDTIHFAAYNQSAIFSIATFYPEIFELVFSEKPYRLRGMATLSEYRRKGYGKALMEYAFKYLKKNKCDVLWCKARLIAIPFYKSLGFKIIGNVYEIKEIGPHYTMFKKF